MTSYTYVGMDLRTAQTHGSVALHTTASDAGHARKLEANQCAYCLKWNPRWKQCHRYLSGKTAVKKSSGMERACDVPPPHVRSDREESSGGGTAFSTFLAVASQSNDKKSTSTSIPNVPSCHIVRSWSRRKTRSNKDVPSATKDRL